MTLRLAVIGDPVDHSLSPEYHRGFLSDYGLPGSYEAIRVPAGTAAARIDELRAAGYAGLNVTTPLKREAFARCDLRDAAARASDSVNTLVLGPQIAGYNTDGTGALGALATAGFGELAGQTILVLGAGPTAFAVALALRDAAATVIVWNRTLSHAEALCVATGARLWFPGAQPAAVFSTLPPDAVPAGDLAAAVREAPLVIDANYGVRATLGTLLGRSDVHDGRAMLRAGARASFEIFLSAR